MVEAEFLLELLMRLFADAARLDGACELLERDVGGKVGEVMSMTVESGPCIFAQKGPRFRVMKGTAVSARSGEAGRGCTA
jgi:hypothetical protein